MTAVARDFIWVGLLHGRAPARWREIAAAIAEARGLTLDDLLGRATDWRTAWARHEAFVAIYDGTALSWPQIGEKFGRHHTTCMKGAERYRERLSRGEVFPSLPSPVVGFQRALDGALA